MPENEKTRRGVLRVGAMAATVGVGLSAGTGQVAASSEDAEVDIKPGSDPNSINPNSKGVIPVGFEEAGNSNFTTQGDRVFVGEVEFSDSKIDGTFDVPRFAPMKVFNTRSGTPNTITTNEVRDALEDGLGVTPVHDGHVKDFNGDGDDDLVLHFDTQAFFDLVDDPSSVENGALIGIMEWDGNTDKRLFDGSDSIRIVGGGGPGGGSPGRGP